MGKRGPQPRPKIVGIAPVIVETAHGWTLTSDWITASEVGRLTGTTRENVRLAHISGRLPGFTTPQGPLFHKDTVAAWREAVGERIDNVHPGGDWVSTDQAARLRGVSVPTVRNWVQAGRVGTIIRGHRRYISRTDLLAQEVSAYGANITTDSPTDPSVVGDPAWVDTAGAEALAHTTKTTLWRWRRAGLVRTAIVRGGRSRTGTKLYWHAGDLARIALERRASDNGRLRFYADRFPIKLADD